MILFNELLQKPNFMSNQITTQFLWIPYVYLYLVTTERNLCFWQKLKVKVDFEMLFINFQLTILSYYFDWMWLFYCNFWWWFYFCQVLDIIPNKIYNTLVLTQMKDNFENEWISFVIISLYQWNCLKPGNYWKLFYYIQIKLKKEKAIYYATNMCKHTGNVQKIICKKKKKIQLHSWQYEEYKWTFTRIYICIFIRMILFACQKSDKYHFKFKTPPKLHFWLILLNSISEIQM